MLVFWFVLAAANGLKVVGSTAVFTYRTIGRAFALPDPGWGILAMATLAAIIAWIVFISSCTGFQLILLSMMVLTASSISSCVCKRCPADLLPASFASIN